MRVAAGGLLCTVALSVTALSAQSVAPNRATAYLFPTDVSDARAIWVNPAGLGVTRDASIYAEVGVGEPGASGRLRQINAGFNSRGLSLGYQRDFLDDGVKGTTLRLGLGGGAGGLAVGFDIARYSGSGANATGWDIGATYVALPKFNVGLVTTNIGQPVVRGLKQRITYIPGLTWHPGPLALSTDARITPDSVESYAFGIAWRTNSASSRWPIEVIARMDTDNGLRRGAFAFGFSIGGENRLGAVASAPGDASQIDYSSIYGLMTRTPTTGRR
ncbi:MAG TPA: hypothetical protein VMR92_04425 [Gemmatimonadales bacterium]|nr:hypothetical protein [Gemmatimonadales bacterium]